MPVYLLSDAPEFPPAANAEPDGLLAIGGDLSVERLRAAYRGGIFPWYGADGPILWYSPDPRLVIPTDGFRVTTSLRRALRDARVTLTFDRAFAEVIQRCADVPRQHEEGTWIHPEMIDAYCALHADGDAHSVEVWSGRELVGGLYGLSVGCCFAGESMFTTESGASKFALAHLTCRLGDWGYAFVDCQLPAPHLERLGGVSWPRPRFLAALAAALRAEGRAGSWQDEPESTGEALLERLSGGRDQTKP